MSLSAVRSRIKTTLSSAAGVGQTYDYFRLAATEADVASLFAVSGVLHVWFVSLADSDPFTTKRHPANHEIGTYEFKLYGYFAVKDTDATEKDFADVVEAVIAAFRGDKKLGETVIDSGPAQWRVGGFRTFAGVLCHYAELDLRVLEQLEP